jgi:hypothetical protein
VGALTISIIMRIATDFNDKLAVESSAEFERRVASMKVNVRFPLCMKVRGQMPHSFEATTRRTVVLPAPNGPMFGTRKITFGLSNGYGGFKVRVGVRTRMVIRDIGSVYRVSRSLAACQEI